MSELFNAADYLVDRHLVEGNGHRTAVTGPAGSLTYAELARQVATAATGWRTAGLRPEERVLLYASDGPDLLVALLSLLRCGAVPVPVSTLYQGAELAVLLRDARARFLLVGAEHTEQAGVALADRPSDLHGVVTIGDTALEHPGVSRLCWHRDVLDSTAETGPADHVTEDSPALWLYTSGTTGTPKATMHRHGSIRFVAEAYGRDVLGIGPDDRCFSAAKLSFAYGLGNSCFLPLAAGATTVLAAARPTPEALAERLVTDRPTVFFAVPTVFATLLRTDDLPDDVFASVRVAVSAGEALPAELQRRFAARFGVDLVNGLGTTETLHIFLSNRPGRTRPGCVGTAVPGYQVRVLTEDGRPAPPGHPGALQVKAPSAASGYWARAEASTGVFRGEWINTGDLFMHDEDGYYTFLGRTNDVIKTGGLWVSPVEVEAHLLTHPDVAEAAVVATPDSNGLDKLVACVVPAAGRRVDTAELIAFCGKELPGYKRPRQILLLDALPTNRTGKVQRRALRELVIERLTDVPEATVPSTLTTTQPTSAAGTDSADDAPPCPLDLMFHQSAREPSTPDASANVGALLRLTGLAPEITKLRDLVANRIDRLPCLTRFLTGQGADVHWDSGRPDLDTHVIEQRLPDGEEHLDEAVSRLRLTTLPADTPPWRLWLLHGHTPESYALFYLTQHDVQDAANIAAVLEGLFGQEIPPELSSAVMPALAEAAPADLPDFVGVLDEVGRCTTGHRIWQDPDRPLSGQREVSWLEVPTELLRLTGRALGGSANDVHLAALGHAVTTWASQHWPAAKDVPIPIMVPLNLRVPGETGRPGNQFFLSRVTVPGGPLTPLRRLAGTITAAAPLKSASHRAALHQVLRAVPRPLLDRFTAAATTPDQLSVVGSMFPFRHPLSCNGDPVDRVAPLICCPDGFPATVALFTYRQVSTACFQIDRALPGGARLPGLWRTAIEEMAAAAGVVTARSV